MRALLAVLLFAAGIPLNAESVELEPIEIRGHRAFSTAIEQMNVPEEMVDLKAEMLGSGAEVTAIMRSWYRRLPEDGKWTADSVVKLENIVLVDLKVDQLRFAWRTGVDYTSGEQTYHLTIWWGARRKETMEIFMAGENHGASDLGSYLEAGRAVREKGHLARNDEILIDYSYGGREWTATFDEWKRGELLPEDRRLLDEALDEQLLDALRILDMVATTTPSLHSLCMMLTHPLLGETADCDLAPEQVVIEGGKPDCTFDAWFGEPCSPTQTAESNLRDNPELTTLGESKD